MDEGHQFFVRRIDFSGNTTTRDKVIRRQLLIDEGEIFNNRLWELSILRLNQLGYFEPLKAEDAADIKRDTKTNTVDITLKVKERGKNSIQLNGGVSGIAGSFVGASYSTNNFLGLGETLSLELAARHAPCVGPVRLHRAVFVRPCRCRPDSRCIIQRFNYNQAREASILAGTNLIPLLQCAGHAEPAELRSRMVTASRSLLRYPLKRSFARVGAHLRLQYSERQDADHRGHELFRLHRFRRQSAGPTS